MKRFLIKVAAFSVLMVLIDRAFILLRYKDKNIFSNISLDKIDRIAHTINQQNITATDIAILGSSHPQFGISPEVIAEITHRSCLNLAYGAGTNTGCQYQLLNNLNIKFNTIVYAIDVFSLNEDAQDSDPFQTELLNKLNPAHVRKNEKNNFLHSLPFYRNEYLTLSYMYLYSRYMGKYFSDVLHGNFSPPYLRKDGEVCDLSMFTTYQGYTVTSNGWVQGHGLLNKNFTRYSGVSFSPKNSSVGALRNIVQFCRDKSIQLVLVQLPEHSSALSYGQKYADFDKWIQQFATESHITYINLNTASAFPVATDSLFFDSDHLNTAGATAASRQLAKALSDLGGQRP